MGHLPKSHPVPGFPDSMSNLKSLCKWGPFHFSITWEHPGFTKRSVSRWAWDSVITVLFSVGQAVSQKLLLSQKLRGALLSAVELHHPWCIQGSSMVVLVSFDEWTEWKEVGHLVEGLFGMCTQTGN
jgi:hypothetical protein